MTYFLFIFRSLTQAQRAAGVLGRGGVPAQVTKAPGGLGGEGCAFAVRIRAQYHDRALDMLRREGLRPVKVEGIKGGVPRP